MEAPAEPSPEQAPLPAPETDPQPSGGHRRTGTVACLPKAIRDKINLMLSDGLTYGKVIADLGEDGKGLVQDHIRSWYKGGFQDYLDQLDRKAALSSNRERAVELLEQNAGKPVQDAGRTVVATQLYELILSFNPASFAASLQDKPELYLRLVNALSRLCEGEATTGYRRLQETLAQAKVAQPSGVDRAKLLSPEELREIARIIKLL